MPPFSKLAGVALFCAILPWLLWGALILINPRGAGDVFFGIVMCTILGGPFVAIALGSVAIKKLNAVPEDDRPRGLLVAKIARGIGLGGIVALFFALCASMTIMRGRQLRRRGKPRLATLTRGDGWSGSSDRIEAPAAVAEAWRHNALTEHASVAAFSHVALDLITHGAPASLVENCHRDALDEIEHTRLCFAIAKAMDGSDRSPQPFRDAGDRPVRIGDGLSAIAIESVIEGALLEGAAAHVATILAARAEHPQIKAALTAIARDEARHAEHGWQFVEWCIATGGDGVRSALAVMVLPNAVDEAGPMPDGSWECFGIAGRATTTEGFARSRADVLARLRSITVNAA